jgi:hypothetical protein
MNDNYDNDRRLRVFTLKTCMSMLIASALTFALIQIIVFLARVA